VKTTKIKELEKTVLKTTTNRETTNLIFSLNLLVNEKGADCQLKLLKTQIFEIFLLNYSFT